MESWEYLNSTNTIWTNFDCGQVEANSYEEAKEKAIAEMQKTLDEANNALKVIGAEIFMDFSNVEVWKSGTPRF